MHFSTFSKLRRGASGDVRRAVAPGRMCPWGSSWEPRSRRRGSMIHAHRASPYRADGPPRPGMGVARRADGRGRDATGADAGARGVVNGPTGMELRAGQDVPPLGPTGCSGPAPSEAYGSHPPRSRPDMPRSGGPTLCQSTSPSCASPQEPTPLAGVWVGWTYDWFASVFAFSISLWMCLKVNPLRHE